MMPLEDRSATSPSTWSQVTGVFRYGRRALELVWQAHRGHTLALAAATVLVGTMPIFAAYFAKEIVDIVATGGVDAPEQALWWVGAEAIVVTIWVASQRWILLTTSLLRAVLGHQINRQILAKALTLELTQFEDSEFYDKLTRARREASTRPLSLVQRTFSGAQSLITVIASSILLWDFSPWAVVMIALTGIPNFVAEARFADDAFRLFRWKSPDSRKQLYVESVLAREDYAKEVKLFGLGRMLLDRYDELFESMYREDRALARKRGVWSAAMAVAGSIAYYGMYGWVVFAAATGGLSIGEMTLQLALLRQSQSAVGSLLTSVNKMYEDHLYLTTLDDYLAQPSSNADGGVSVGAQPGDGIRFENVSFTYPGAQTPALTDISFHLPPGQALALVGENGSGKTTLIKLLGRLYQPQAGTIYLDKTPLSQWTHAALLARLGVIFQDFCRFQWIVGENIGAGDVDAFADEARWQQAATQGKAAPFIDELPSHYTTQLGKWFKGGVELSGGQWQKIALSRAFMRTSADILVLDEPTAAMDAGAEVEVFEHVRKLAHDKMVLLISHRFSTVRAADEILVMEHGRIQERGNHQALLAHGGIYSRLFHMQAEGYK